MFGSRQGDRMTVPTVLLLLLVLAVISGIGCRKYQTVQTKEAMELIKALYSACSSENEERLERVKLRLEEAVEQQTVAAADAQAMSRIIAIAESGDWSRATREAYRMASDQTRGRRR